MKTYSYKTIPLDEFLGAAFLMTGDAYLSKDQASMRVAALEEEGYRLHSTTNSHAIFERLMNKSLEKIQKKDAEVRAYMEERSSFGAADSEPRWALDGLIEDFLRNGTRNVPEGARGWQLYERKKGVVVVAKKLTRLTNELLDTIGEARMVEMSEVLKWYRTCHGIG